MGDLHDMSGWGWLFGSVMMLIWVALIGFVVYIAVRLAQDHSHRDRHT